MTNTIPPLTWVTVDNWSTNHLVGFDTLSGLIRFLAREEIVYFGMETVSIANVRRFATPGGSAQGHPGGRAIYARRHSLTLQYALLDVPPWKLERIRNALILEHQPRFNFEDHEAD